MPSTSELGKSADINVIWPDIKEEDLADMVYESRNGRPLREIVLESVYSDCALLLENRRAGLTVDQKLMLDGAMDIIGSVRYIFDYYSGNTHRRTQEAIAEFGRIGDVSFAEWKLLAEKIVLGQHSPQSGSETDWLEDLNDAKDTYEKGEIVERDPTGFLLFQKLIQGNLDTKPINMIKGMVLAGDKYVQMYEKLLSKGVLGDMKSSSVLAS